MALANEFQKKQQLEARQFQASQPQTGPKEHPEDTLIVCNILVNDNTEIDDVIPYANPKSTIDPTTGQPHFVNQIKTDVFQNVWNTKDFFEVRWDGRPHRIRPGETRNMPRYLAEHFAKNLIDFILQQREEKEKVTGLARNRNERLKLYNLIITGVTSFYNGDSWDYEREGTYVEQQVERLNVPDNAFNAGVVSPVAIGYGTTDEPPEPVQDLPQTPDAPAPTKPMSEQELIDSKTRNGLMAEAKALGIKLTGQENKVTLYQMIKNFAGL